MGVFLGFPVRAFSVCGFDLPGDTPSAAHRQIKTSGRSIQRICLYPIDSVGSADPPVPRGRLGSSANMSICHPRHPLRVAWRHIARQTRTASYPFASPARKCRITRPAPFSRLIAPERTPSVRNVLARARPRSQSTARRSNSTTVAPGFVRKRLAN